MKLNLKRKSFNLDRKIVEIIYSHSHELNYPYSIKKVLENRRIKEIDNIDVIINNIEQFFLCLSEMKDINPLNISCMGIYLINDSLDIRNIIFDECDYDIKERKLKYYFCIKSSLKKYNINKLNDSIVEETLYADYNNLPLNELQSLNKNQINEIFLKLIYENAFAYSDILVKFILEKGIADLLSFKITYNKGIKMNMRSFLAIIDSMINLIHELHILFNRNNIFIYKTLKDYIMINSDFQDYFRRIINENLMSDRFKNNISIDNKVFIINKFIKGLQNMKEYLLIETQNYSNVSFYQFRRTEFSKKYNFVKQFSNKLDDSSIYTVFALSHINKDKEVTNYIEHLENFILDLEKNNKDILVTKQVLNDKQKQVLIDIMASINDYAKEMNIVIKNACLSNLNDFGRNLNFISFNVIQNDNEYLVKISKCNKDLISYIYFEGMIIHRELCIGKEDIKRIIFIINSFDQDYLIKKKYNII